MKRAFMAFIIFIFLYSACTPGNPSAISAPTQDKPATATQNVIPTSMSLSTSTPVPSPIPDTLYVNPSHSLGPISP